MLQLSHTLVDEVSLLPYIRFITRKDHHRLYRAPAGQEHYKLLHYLASQVDTDIVELGTHHGTGSLALAVGTNHVVHTFDIRDLYSVSPSPSNIKRYIGNIFDLGQADLMLLCDLVFLDTAHRGKFEWEVYTYLVENGFTGILLLDDIHLNEPMEEFWESIYTTKYDITGLGHGFNNCGTGLVDFGGHIQNDVAEIFGESEEEA